MLKEFLNNSYLFGGNAPFIEELYEKYLVNPQSVPEEWRDYFDRMQVLPGASDKDVAHAPVVESLRAAREERASSRSNARCAAEPVTPERLQVAALLLVTAYRIAGSRWATVDPLKRMPRPQHPGARAGVLRPQGSRPRPGGELGLVRRAGAGLAANPGPGAARHLLPQHRLRVHVHLRPRAAAVDPGAHRADARRAEGHAGRAEAPAAEAHRGRAPRALPAHALRRPEALLARRRREPDPVDRRADPARRRPPACRRS